MLGTLFHRPVRTYPDPLPQNAIEIVPPPPLAPKSSGSTLQLLIPMVGMLASVLTSIFFFRQPFMLVASGGMLVGSIGGGFFMRHQQAASHSIQVQHSRSTYLRYLEQQDTLLANIALRQKALSERFHPDLQQLVDRVSRREFVWERRLGDSDFLLVRIGVGVEPLCSPVRVATSSDPFAEYDPDLLARAQAVVAKHAHIEGAAIAVPLATTSTLALVGDRQRTRACARALLCQIAAAHGPDDVRIVAYMPEHIASEWEWLKWLPHTRRLRLMKADTKRPGEQLCLLAGTTEELAAILASQVMPEIDLRRKLTGEARQTPQMRRKPHFVIVLDDFAPRSPVAMLPGFMDLFQDAEKLGVTLLCLVDDRSNEPSFLQGRVDIANAGWAVFEETAFAGRRTEGISVDRADTALCDQLARMLAPLNLGEGSSQSDLAQDVRLLDLLGIPSASQVDTRQNWSISSREDLLRVPVGICADGSSLIIDLKEASEHGMGPHGLIIGATGSGKSELLRTLVTSLALRHGPDLVSFVLADFKGGAAFADLAQLPHSAGMISNLQSDLAMVDRMRDALFGEQERRQRMLREAGNLDNIQQYHTKRQMNPEMEPMPHLMIIVDEFAELLASRPDFLELFITIGRVGRSLGMHLLLATQRLGEGRISGLEGHLRYRICLRTFSAAESSAVIGTPDAFYLPSFPGIGYFKVDTNIYKQFKTATVSSPFVSAVSVEAANIEIREFSRTGRLQFPPPQSEQSSAVLAADVQPQAQTDNLSTDMDVVITRLRDTGSQQEQTHKVWLPPLPSQLSLRSVFHLQLHHDSFDGTSWSANPPFGLLRTPIGMLDLPAEQRQEALVLDFSGAGGHLALVGAPQSGKSTLLQTIVTSFAVTHTPRDVQIYAIDLGGGLLRPLGDLPHVGAVCDKAEPARLQRLVHQVKGIIEEREYQFSQLRIDGISTYRARRLAGQLLDQPFGDVFLVIDDLGQLQTDFSQLDADVAAIVATGLSYGVHVIAATKRWMDIRSKMRDSFGTRLELRLNDPTESEFRKAAAMTLTGATPGRGIIKGGLQFQSALPIVDPLPSVDASAARESLLSFVPRVRTSWRGSTAPAVRVLPDLVHLKEMIVTSEGEPPGVPIGIEDFTLSPLYIDLLTSDPHFLIFGDGESGKTNLLRMWLRELERRYTPEQVRFSLVDYRRNLLDFLESGHLFSYACTPQMVKTTVDQLKHVLDERTLSSGQLTIEDLRNPRRWSGPQHFLVVDDYETVVTPSASPLAPLADLIQQGRDVGLHVILARKVAGAGRGTFEAVFQRLKESGSAGLIMSGDVQEGALLGNQRASTLPPGRGYLVRRNQRTMLLQTPLVIGP